MQGISSMDVKRRKKETKKEKNRLKIMTSSSISQHAHLNKAAGKVFLNLILGTSLKTLIF
jgi:hypothetical protein